jgi:hypothetical protein
MSEIAHLAKYSTDHWFLDGVTSIVAHGGTRERPANMRLGGHIIQQQCERRGGGVWTERLRSKRVTSAVSK